MGRKSNTEERRAQITAALLAVMAEKGYEGASIQAIAKQAGLTPGLIHYHFKTKQEILLATVDQLVAGARARYESALKDAQTPADQLRALIHARLALGAGADEAAVSAWVMIGAEAVRQAEVRAAYQVVIAEQLDLIAALLTKAGLRKDLKAKEVAAGLVATMEGAYQLASAAAEVMPRNYAERQVLAKIDEVLEGKH